MVSFVESRRRRQLDDWKMLAYVGYSTGIIGSMALSKTRPRFDDIYNFPKENQKPDVERSKLEMIAWAENVNRIARKKEVKFNE